MHSRLCSSLTRASAVLAAALLLGAPSLSAQQTGTVTGRVTDAQGGAPIASVQIYIEGLNLGALTQQNGRYLLVNVPAGTHTVTAARIGYGTVTSEVTVGAGATVVQDLVLAQEALQLQEVIVTGTVGQTQRRALGNSVERLSAASVTEQAPITNVQNLMAARTPGLRFSRVEGQVGGGASVSIRGVNSVNLGSMPLIYIDGVRVQNDATLGPSTGDGSSASALSDLSPDQIESIEVIKGPSAATLYGTEASAGVIQIITKKGSVGAPEFTIETSQGTNFMNHPQETLGTQYACAVNQSQCAADNIREYFMYDEAGDYLRGTGRFQGFTPAANTSASYEPGTRSGDLFQNGWAQRYNASVRGGLDQVRYFLSGSYGDEVGIIDYNTNTQASARANVTVLLSESINLDVAMGYTQGATQFITVPSEGGVWHQLVWSRGYNLPGLRTATGSGFLGFQERFPQAYEKTDISRDYSRFTASAQATHTYGDWLTQRLILGIDKGAETDNSFIPGASDFPNAPNGAVTYGRPVDQRLTFDYSVSAAYQATSSLKATTAFGAQYYTSFNESVTNSGLGFPTTVQTVILQTEFSDRQVGFSSIENKSLGFFVQEELNWQDRVYITGAVRADDNSAFGGQFDLQYYPKLSASWVLSEEGFFPQNDVVNSLRLRGAWGRSGRQPGTFAGQTLYSTILGPNGNGLYPSTAGNTEVGPEVSTEIEVGADIAFFNDRLSTEFSYYHNTTADMLVNQSLAPSTGLTGSRQANLGEMTSHGWEASVDARLFQSETVAVDLTLSGDYTYNEITALGEGVLPSGNYQLGYPFPTIVSDYIITSAEMNTAGTNYNVATVMCQEGTNGGFAGGPNIFPGGGDILCSDYSDTGILLGTAFPKYSFSVGPTVTLFQDLQVFALAEGQYGRWIASTDANYACRFYRSCLTAVTRDEPMFLAGTGAYYDDRYNGRFPADFWRLRQLGARYNLPQNIVSKIGADRASLSVSGNNLFILWQKTTVDKAGNNIYDPEYSINTSSAGAPSTTALWEMPGLASFNAQLRISF
jgi:TonB-linked SusC/RagA family outer membrane protein